MSSARTVSAADAPSPGRFGASTHWDMLPGAFHFWETIEFLYALKKLGYTDEWYAFDVYPKELDTAENFAAAFQITRKHETITDRIDVPTIEQLLRERNSAKTLPYLYSLL